MTKTLIGTTTFRRFDPCLQKQYNGFNLCQNTTDWVVAPDGEVAYNWCVLQADALRFRPIGSGKRLGVAGNKNRVISYFLDHREYDHLFLIEDDVWPIRGDWQEFYLDAQERSGSGCLLFLPPGMYGKTVWYDHKSAGAVVGMERDGGMLLSLTRGAVETCGGLHPSFEIYGGEHSEYARRLTRNKQMVYTRATPVLCEKYLDGLDYANYQGRLKDISMAPFTMNVEKVKDPELRKHAKRGLEIFEKIKDSGGCFQNPGDWTR